MDKIQKNKDLFLENSDYFFLNDDSALDKLNSKSYEYIYILLDMYSSLVVDFIIDDRDIDEIYVLQWSIFFNLLKKNVVNSKDLLFISIHLNKRYEYLLEWCVKNEYYEAAHNIKNFNDKI
jgi:hypothetical protein